MLRSFARKRVCVTRWLKDARFATAQTTTPCAPLPPSLGAIPHTRSWLAQKCTGGTTSRWMASAMSRQATAAEDEGEDAESVPPSVETWSVSDYTRKLRRLTRDGHYGQAFRVHEEMRKRNISPDTRAYTAIMKAHSRHGDTAMVQQLFDEMIASGVKPDKYVFNTYIYAYTNDGDMEAAFAAFNKMQEKYEIPPDPVTHRSLITVCGKGKDMKRAKEVFQTSLEKEKDIRNYNAMIDAYSESVDEETADEYLAAVKSMMEEIKTKGLKPDSHTYGHLIKFCGRAGYAEEAMQFIEEAKNKDVSMSLGAYDNFITGLGKLKLTDEACAEKLRALFANMEKQKVKPTSLTFDRVMDLYDTRGDLAKGLEFIESLKGTDAGKGAPVYSVRLLYVEKLAEKGEIESSEAVDMAAKAVAKAKEDGVNLNHAGMKAWFHICIEAGDVEKAYESWDAFTTSGKRPSPKMCDQMVELTLQKDRIDDSIQLLSFVQEKGIPPLESSFESVFASLAESGDSEKGAKVHTTMKEAGVEPGEKTRQYIESLGLE